MATPILEARALSKQFDDGIARLSSVDLRINDGEFIVLAGPNGSGKSLLMRHFIGLERPTSGSALFRGNNVLAAGSSIVAKIGYVFQNAERQTLGDTVLDDAALGPRNLGLEYKAAQDAARTALAECGLAGYEERMAFTLSGGEGRRLAIAAIVAMAPEILILDEPFANLDYPGVRSVVAIMEKLSLSGTTVIVVTHELEKVLGLADRVVLMKEGRIVYDGKIREDALCDIERFGLKNPFSLAKNVEDLVWR